jgi:preprotein translocase subunit SecA
MAGRGTDIKLGSGVEALGGLHVIATEPHSSRRVERQLFGRAARQGARGSVSAYYSFEDEFWGQFVPTRIVQWLGKLSTIRSLRSVSTPLNKLCLYFAQKRSERIARQVRKQVAENETTLRASLGFSK